MDSDTVRVIEEVYANYLFFSVKKELDHSLRRRTNKERKLEQRFVTAVT